MKAVYILILILALTSSALSSSWHHPLYVGGGGYWKARIPVKIWNDTAEDMAGTPIPLTIGTDHGELDLVGESAVSVRVCDESGSEYLFDIVRADGALARDEIIEAGDRLVIPAECNASSAKTYYVYFRNPQAWPVPDFFEASPGIRNGNMESGKRRPSAWTFDAGDGQHQVSWVTEDPHSMGSRRKRPKFRSGHARHPCSICGVDYGFGNNGLPSGAICYDNAAWMVVAIMQYIGCVAAK